MSAESDIKTALEAAGVTALVSTRVYPDIRPQDDALPAIVYGRDSTEFITTIHGTVALTRAQMYVGCYAETRAGAEAVANAAHTALLAAGLLPLNRKGDYEDETNGYIVAQLFEHITAG